MAIERTLSIVKPDAVAKNLIGDIFSRFEKSGLQIVAVKMIQLTTEDAGGFYSEHEGKPFYDALVEYMCSGALCVQVLLRRVEASVHRRQLELQLLLQQLVVGDQPLDRGSLPRALFT